MLDTKQNSFRHVGRPQRRADAPRTFDRSYPVTQDLVRRTPLRVRLVRSPYASAKIVSVASSRVARSGRIVAVSPRATCPSVDIEKAPVAHARSVMAFRSRRPCRPADPSRCLRNRAAAQDGVDAVEVEYEPGPMVIDPVAAQTSDGGGHQEARAQPEELAMHGAAT